MIFAVQTFNNPSLKFKTEIFAVLAIIAWTYLLHEFYERKKVQITKKKGHTISLNEIIKRKDCPLSDGAKNNIKSIKCIRDDVEHKLLGRGDTKWRGLYQACCLNYDDTIRRFFGDELSLANELSFALQFSRMDVEQISDVQKYDIPSHIEALDARLKKDLTEDQLKDLEHQFRVIYTFDSSSKGRSHLKFVHPDTEEGKEIRNVLVSYKPADHLYPHKPKKVCEKVSEKAGVSFSSHNHIQAWKHYKVRPPSKAKQPENTNKDFCIYHQEHGDYTYSDAWIDFLANEIKDAKKFAIIKSFKVGR